MLRQERDDDRDKDLKFDCNAMNIFRIDRVYQSDWWIGRCNMKDCSRKHMRMQQRKQKVEMKLFELLSVKQSVNNIPNVGRKV